jgi:hypothetical protein
LIQPWIWAEVADFLLAMLGLRRSVTTKEQRAGGAIDFAYFFSTIVMKKEEAL